MIFDIIAQGDKIELAEKKDSSVCAVCSGKVVHCSKEGIIELAIATESVEQAGLKIKGSYQACFFTTKGVFCADGKIMEINSFSEQVHITISFITGLERLHYRHYYRYSAAFEMKYQEIGQEEWRTGKMVDFSGGGCRFNSVDYNEKEKHIRVCLPFMKQREEMEDTIEAVVVSSEPLMYKKGYYENRVKFVNVRQGQKECIIQYIFEEEKRIRVKERRL